MANSKKTTGASAPETNNVVTEQAEKVTLASIGANALIAAMPIIAGAYGDLFASAKSTLGEKFDEATFWNGGYHKNSKGQSTLDALAKRSAVATFKGFNPNTGRPLFATDKLASRVFGWFTPVVRAGIHSMSEFEQAVSKFGSAELVFRYALDLGPAINFARKVADAYKGKVSRKAAIKVAIANFDTSKHAEFAILHARVAIAQLVDPSIDLSTVYDWTVNTLAAQVNANKAAAATGAKLTLATPAAAAA